VERISGEEKACAGDIFVVLSTERERNGPWKKSELPTVSQIMNRRVSCSLSAFQEEETGSFVTKSDGFRRRTFASGTRRRGVLTQKEFWRII